MTLPFYIFLLVPVNTGGAQPSGSAVPGGPSFQFVSSKPAATTTAASFSFSASKPLTGTPSSTSVASTSTGLGFSVTQPSTGSYVPYIVLFKLVEPEITVMLDFHGNVIFITYNTHIKLS